MGDAYVTTAGVQALRRTSYTLEEQVWSAGTLRADYSCVIVLMTPDGSARMPIPDALRRAFMQRDGALPED